MTEIGKRSSDLSADEDSIELMIEPDRKEMLRHTDFDIKYREDDSDLCLYIELDPKDIAGLVKEAAKGTGFTDERKNIKNCIFLRKIETPHTAIKGNFHITYLTYKGICFNVYLNSAQVSSMRYSRMRVHYQIQDKWVSEWIMGVTESESSTPAQSESKKKCETYKFEVKANEVQKILKQKLLLCISLEKDHKYSKEYNGLYNSGNICYMNSIIQVLYHFMPLRKMIIEKNLKKEKKKSKLIENLQEVFLELMTSKSVVDGDEILESFQQFNRFPRQQHDIHEFMMALFDAIENECPEVKHFWSGKQFQETYSRVHNYKSEQELDFNEIQLFMTDTKGNHFATIQESLEEVLKEEKLDGLIEHDNKEIGKIEANKIRSFAEIPPLLFLNIQRYKYNSKRMEATKINLDMSYPDKMNLNFLVNTPGGSMDYILYSVIVHKGLTPNRGHYFSFVNVSKKANKPHWFEFNDSRVSETTTEKVMNNFTGKKKQQIYLNETYGKWCGREQSSEETAYMLVYLRKDLFAQYQNIDIQIPNFHMQKLQKKLTEEEARTKTSVKVFVLRNQEDFDPFCKTLELIELKLTKFSTFEKEFQNLQTIISCKVGSIWKVNRKTEKIKRIIERYGSKSQISIEKHIDFSKGFRQPDYILIVPKEFMPDGDQNLGVLHLKEISENEEKQGIKISNKLEIKNFLEKQMTVGDNLSFSEDKAEQFFQGWNDFLEVTKE